MRAGPAVSTAQREPRNTASWMLWVTTTKVVRLSAQMRSISSSSSPA